MEGKGEEIDFYKFILVTLCSSVKEMLKCDLARDEVLRSAAHAGAEEGMFFY